MRVLPRLFRPFRRPVLRLLFRLSPPQENHWEKIRIQVPYYFFGRGSIRRFSWYFEGESRVSVQSLNDVCDWLRECEYVRDPELFHDDDYWQHPKTFEQLRRGDCEDHALWAWRKLVELKMDAHLFVGRWKQHGDTDAGSHAWIVYEDAGIRYVMETVTKSESEMVRKLDDVREGYSPHFSVNAWYRSQGYVGYLHELMREVGLAPGNQAA